MNRALAFALAVFSITLAHPLQGASSAGTKEEGKALCQITVFGLVEESLPRVSMSVTHGRDTEELRETTLSVQLNGSTKAVDVLGLFADRLERAGARLTRPAGSGDSNHATFFVEDVVSVRIEDSGGFEISILFCDRPLGVLSLKAVRPDRSGGELAITGILVDSDGKSRELKTLNVEIFGSDTGHNVCKRLYDVSLNEGWLPFRAQTDQWSPNRRKDSKVLESTEVDFSLDGWTLELTVG